MTNVSTKKLILKLGILLSLSIAQTVLAGPGDGAGGKIKNKPKSAISISEVQRVLGNIQTPTKYVFNYIESFLGSDPSSKLFMKKVFGKNNLGKDIYWYLNPEHAKVVTTGPCFDNDHNIVDASQTFAHDGQPDQVCFDSEKIAPTLDSSNYFVSLVAMAVHEYSHFMYTTDTDLKTNITGEADTLQDAVLSNLNPSSQLYYEAWNKNISDDLKYLDNTTEALQEIAKKGPFGELCVGLGEQLLMAVQFDDKVRNAINLGMLPVRKTVDWRIQGLVVKVGNLQSVCVEDKVRGDLEKGFNGQSSVSLTEYALARNWAKHPYEGIIRKLNYQDLDTIQLEFKDVRDTILKLKRQIK